MQILPSTWASILARHQIPPGGSAPPSRYNAHDAIHVAAFYLCDNGAATDLRAAIFAYNHSDRYVNQVLNLAERYRGVPVPSDPGQLRTQWPAEAATMPDPTSNGRLTPRAYTLAHALLDHGMTGDAMTCVAPRPANPDSDHPAGKACDIMLNPHNPAAIAQGWQLANWLAANKAVYGIRYIIWQGRIWTTDQPPPGRPTTPLPTAAPTRTTSPAATTTTYTGRSPDKESYRI